MKLQKNLFLLGTLLLGLKASTLLAQGCSDAGFCTLNSFKPHETTNTPQNQLKIGAFFGGADHNIAVWGNYIEYNRQLDASWSLDAKLTSLSQNGNGIATFGLGDLFLNANRIINPKLTATLGVKLPLQNGNATNNNNPLPMDYQSSLGTLDLVAGLGYKINKLQLVAAVQLPISQNKNQFLAEVYPTNANLRLFQSTNNFKRSGDVLLRIAYPFELTQKLQFTASALPIYHLKNDQYTDLMGTSKTISGSQGITLNANMYFDYKINEKNALQLNIGSPLKVREARPDGLTRSFVANLEYKYQF